MTPDDFAAWTEGRTGYPVVDAAMRQLIATGWMHNRARMIAASFLTKDLLIDWRLGERYFMQHLLDGDPAANNGGWQWTAGTGTDAAPYFRVFNPVLQGIKFDPRGATMSAAGCPSWRLCRMNSSTRRGKCLPRCSSMQAASLAKIILPRMVDHAALDYACWQPTVKEKRMMRLSQYDH